jgi:hypothetical protein
MLFDLQEDLGWRITAYLVPDSGGATPVLRVLNAGVELARLEANQPLPALVSAGRHTTGQCGFAIDETLIPGLAEFPDIELVEPESGIMIYRRPPPHALDGPKMFRLETHLLPLWRLDDLLNPRFHSWYRGIDRYGRETSTQVFCLQHSKSTYASGRVLYKNYEYYLRNGVSTMALLRDPYHELAERLIVLQRIGSGAESILGARDALMLAPLMALLAENGPLDEEGCRRLFKKGQKQIYEPLFNPLTRQLTASTPDEPSPRSGVATALEVLSSFALLGLRERGDDFTKAVAEMVGIGADRMPPLGEHSRVTGLAAQLRAISWMEAFLEHDLEVFEIVRSAFSSVSEVPVVSADPSR